MQLLMLCISIWVLHTDYNDLSYLYAWGFAPVAGIIYYKIYTINNNWGFAPVAGIIYYKIYTINNNWKNNWATTQSEKWLGYNPRLGTN